jgi:hypothetical protein
MELLNRLSRGIPAWALIGACLLLVVLVAGLDYATGAELSFSIFYVIPVAIAAWHATPERGYVVAVASALVA